ncbi:hypothetical protein, partial [Streptomyces sp. uw30]|uniref:hypothetical protein n=1 Tax=Streptomyces sp. uw30 TaxID=1828179 RepID=UPI001C9BD43E
MAGEDEDGSAVAGGGPALRDVFGGGAVGQRVQGSGEVVATPADLAAALAALADGTPTEHVTEGRPTARDSGP